MIDQQGDAGIHTQYKIDAVPFLSMTGHSVVCASY
jgi:hypothetical protein